MREIAPDGEGGAGGEDGEEHPRDHCDDEGGGSDGRGSAAEVERTHRALSRGEEEGAQFAVLRAVAARLREH